MKKSSLVVSMLAVFSCTAAHGADVFVPGNLRQEIWTNRLRADVLQGTAGTPTSLNYLDSFQVPDEQGANYTERVSGFFIPPATGNYVFFVTSDDDSDLFLSTDDSPGNKRLIAQETLWSNPLEWTASGGGSNLNQKRSDRFQLAGSTNAPFAAGIPLTAGTRYYIEGVHHEGTGGDNFAATYKLISEPDPEIGTPSALTGNVIGLLAPSEITFVSQPFNRRVLTNDTVTLSVLVEPPTAQLQWFRNGTAIPGATESTYTISPVTTAEAGATYHVVATDAGATVQSSNAVITLGEVVLIPAAKEEFWGQETLGGFADRTIVEDPSFNTPPDIVRVLPRFETAVDQADEYVNRVSALFVPPVTGDYVFFIAADDDSTLFLSTNESPATKRQIAAEVNWSSFRNWTGNEGGTNNFELQQKRSDQWVPDPENPPATPPFANGIPLVAGSSYYLEAVHHEGGGGDNLAVTYKLRDEPDPAPFSVSRLDASVFAPYAPTMGGGTVTITNPLQNVTAFQSQTATLNLGAAAGYIGDTSGAGPAISYQWQAAPAGSTAFTNIPGALSTSYTTPLLRLEDQNTQYRVAIRAADVVTNTPAVTLTVSPDVTPPGPSLVTGVNAAFTEITLNASELLDPVSAQVAANYSFSPGSVTVTSAVLDPNGTNITLTTSGPLTANTELTLAFNGVRDLAGNPASNATVGFSFRPVTYADNILFDQPLAYYRFEETSGSVATNSGTMGGHGVYYMGDELAPGEGGTPSSAKGDPGPQPPLFAGFDASNRSATFTGPFGFGGNEDWVDTRHQFLQNLSAFTLEYWVKPVGRTNDGVVNWPNRVGLVGQNDAIEYGFITPGTIQIWTPAPNSGALDTPYPFPDDEWHHVATIADGRSIRTYYDGVLRGTSTGNNANYGGSTFNVHIGGGGVFDNVGNYFTGNLDEVAIFDKAIPAERVAAHFRAGKEGGVIVTSASTPTGPAFTSVRLSAGQLTLQWEGTATLEEANSVLGPWTPSGNQTSPQSVPVTGVAKFYRLRQ